jgi:hypothetical protein
MRNMYKILVGKPEGNGSFGRSRHKWEDIKFELKEIEREGVDWFNVAQDRNVGVLLLTVQ